MRFAMSGIAQEVSQILEHSNQFNEKSEEQPALVESLHKLQNRIAMHLDAERP